MQEVWKVFREDPRANGPFVKLRAHYRSVSDLPQLIALYEERATAVGGAEAVRLLARAAGYFSAMGQHADAVRTYRDAIESDGNYFTQQRESHVAYLRAQASHKELAALFEAEALCHPDPVQQRQGMLDCCLLALTEANDPRLAASYYTKALDLSRGLEGFRVSFLKQLRAVNPERFGERALALVSALLEDAPVQGTGRHHGGALVSALHQHFPDAKIGEAVRTYEGNTPGWEAIVDVVDDSIDAADLLTRARAAIEAGNLQRAFEYYLVLLDRESTPTDVSEGLLKLYAYGHQRERIESVFRAAIHTFGHKPLLEIEQIRLLDAASREEEAKVHFDIAMVHQSLGEVHTAREALLRAHEAAPGEASYVSALRKLEAENESYVEADAWLEKEIGFAAKDPEAVAALYVERSSLMRQQGDALAALEWAGKAVNVAPDWAGGRRALRRLVASAEASEALSAFEAKSVTDTTRIAKVHILVASELRAQLGHLKRHSPERKQLLAKAVRSELEALKSEQDLGIVDEVIERLASSEQDHDIWQHLLEVLAALVPKVRKDEVSILAERIMDVIDGQLGAPTDAGMGALHAVFARLPSSLELYNRILDLCRSHDLWSDAERLIRHALEFSKWAHLHVSKERRVALLLDLTEILRRQDKENDAHEVLLHLSFVVPGHKTAMEHLRQRADNEVNRRVLYEAITRSVEAQPEPSEKAKQELEMGRLAYQGGPRGESALAHGQRALELSGDEVELRLEARAFVITVLREGEEVEPLISALEADVEDTAVSTHRRRVRLETLAQLFDTKVGDFDRAHACLRRVLEDWYHNHSAHQNLIAWCAEKARHEDEISARRSYHDLLLLEPNDDQLSANSVAIADLLERVGRPRDAVEALRANLAFDQHWEAAYSRMSALLAELEAWAAYLDLADELFEKTTPANTRVAEYSRKAVIAEEKAGDVARAIAYYESAHVLEPSNLLVLRSMEPLYKEVSDWEKLLSSYRNRLRHSADLLEQAEVNASIGEVYLGHLEEYGLARDAFNAAIELDFTYVRAHEGLLESYRRLGDARALVAAIGAYLPHVESSVQTLELMHERSDVSLHQRARVDDAIEFLRQAAEAFPEDEPTWRRLQDLLVSEERFSEVVEVVEKRLALAQDDAQRLTRLYELADARETGLGDHRGASDALEDALLVMPEKDETWWRLVHLHERAEAWTEALRVLDRQVARHSDDKEKAGFIEIQSSIYLDRLGAPTDAFEALERAYALDPHPKLLNELRRIGTRFGQERRLVVALTREAEHALPGHRVPLLFEAADLLQGPCADAEATFDHLDRYFLVEARQDGVYARGDAEAMLRMQALCEKRPDFWPRFVNILTQINQVSDDAAENVRRWWLVADIYLAHLQEPRRALQAYEQAWRVGADRGESIERFNRSAQKHGLWEEIVAFNEVRSDYADSHWERVQLYRRNAQIAQTWLNDRDKYKEYLTMAFRLSPQTTELEQAVRYLVREDEDWDTLAEIYGLAVDRFSGEPERAVEFALKQAKVYEAQLDDVAGAVDCLIQAAELEAKPGPGHRAFAALVAKPEGLKKIAHSPELLMKAADQLNRNLATTTTGSMTYQVWQQAASEVELRAFRLRSADVLDRDGARRLRMNLVVTRRWRDLSRVLETLASLKEGQERFAHLEERGVIHLENLRKPLEALPIFEQALQVHPDEALFERAYLLAQTHDKGRRVPLLVWALEHAPWAEVGDRHSTTKPRRIDLLARLCELNEQVDDVWWDALANLAPNHVLVRQRFSVGLETDVEKHRWLRILVAGAEQGSKAIDNAHRYREAARFALEHLGDEEGAIRYLALAIDEAGFLPERAALQLELEQLLVDAGRLRELARRLEARVADSDGDIGELLRRIAEVHQQRGDLPRTARALERLLAAHPEQDEVYVQLIELYAQLGRSEDEVLVLQALLDPNRAQPFRRVVVGSRVYTQAPLQLRLARLLADSDRAEMAIEIYQNLLSVPEQRDTSLEEISELLLYRAPARLCGLLENRASVARDNGRKVALWRRAAELYEEMGDLERARERWEDVACIRPTDMGAMSALLRLHEDLGEYEPLRAVVERMLSFAHDTEAKVHLLHIEARALSAMDRVDELDAVYGQILELDPSDDLALDTLRARWKGDPRLRALLEMVLRHEEREVRRFELYVELADLVDGPMEVAEALEGAWRIDPARLTLANRLLALYQEQGFYRRASYVLKQVVAAEERVETKVNLLLELASLYRDKCDSPEEALVALDEAALHRPLDAEVHRLRASMQRYLGQTESLVRTLLTIEELELDTGERRALFNEVAGLVETEDPAAAFAYRVRAHALNEDFTDDYPELLRLAGKAGRYEALLEVFEEDAERAAGPASRCAVLQLALEVCVDCLSDFSKVAFYADWIGADSDYDDLRIQIYMDYGEKHPEVAKDAVQVLLGIADEDFDAGIEPLLMAAKLLEKPLQKPDEALALLSRALRESRGDAHVWYLLNVHCERYGSKRTWFEVASSFWRALPPLQASVEVARTLSKHARTVLGHDDAERLLFEALSVAPGDTRLHATLRESAVRHGRREQILAGYEEIYRHLLGSADRDVLKDFLDQIHALSLLEGTPADHLEAYVRRAHFEGVGAVAHAELAAFALAEDLVPEYRDALLTWAERLPAKSERIALMLEAAALFEEADDTVAVLRRVLALEPGHKLATERLEHSLAMAGSINSLISLYSGHASQEGKLAGVLRRAAEGQPPSRAVEHLRSALKLRPNDAQLRSDLAAAYVELDRPDKVLELIDGRQDDDGRFDPLWVQLEGLFARHNRRGAVLKCQLEILRRSPQRRTYAESLFARLRGEGRLEALRSALGARASALEGLHGGSQDVSLLGPELISVLERLAALEAELGLDEEAGASLLRLLERAPNHESSLLRLADMAEEAGELPLALTYLDRLAESLSSLLKRSDVRQRMAELHLQRFDDPDMACELFAAALECTPANASLHLRYGLALVQAGRREESQVALRRALDLRGKARLDQEQRCRALAALAEVLEGESPDEACKAWLTYLDHNPDDVSVRQSLLGLLPKEALDTRLRVLLPLTKVGTSAERAARWLEVAELEQERGGIDAALAAYTHAIEVEPHVLDVHRVKGELELAHERWPEAAATFGTMLAEFSPIAIESSTPPEHTLHPSEKDLASTFLIYLLRQARALRKAEALSEAHKLYRQALRLSPGHQHIVLGLLETGTEGHERDRLLALLVERHLGVLDEARVQIYLLEYARELVGKRREKEAIAHAKPHVEALDADALTWFVELAKEPSDKLHFLEALAVRAAQGDTRLKCARLAASLGDADKACQYYQKVEQLHVDDQLRFAEALIAAGQPREAANLIQTLQPEALGDKASHFYLVWADLEDTAEARLQGLRRAFAAANEEGLSPVVRALLQHFLAEHNALEPALAALRSFFEEERTHSLAQLCIVLADLLDQRGAYQEAIEVLSEVVRDSRDLDARRALFTRLVAHKDRSAALVHAEYFLRHGELGKTRLSNLRKLFADLRNPQAEQAVLELKALCNLLDRKEQEALQGFRQSRRRGLFRTPRRHTAWNSLMRILGDAERLAAILPPPALGVPWRESAQMGPVASILDSLAGELRSPTRLMCTAGDGPLIEVVWGARGEPTVQVCPSRFSQHFNREQRFLLARAVWLARPEHVLAAALDDSRLAVVEEALFGPERVGKEARAFRHFLTLLPRRKVVQNAITALKEAGETDLSVWRRGVLLEASGRAFAQVPQLQLALGSLMAAKGISLPADADGLRDVLVTDEELRDLIVASMGFEVEGT